MIKRTVTETVYEYDKQGNIIKKIVTETHEEEDNTTLTYPSTPINHCPNFLYTTYSNGAELNRNDITTIGSTKITN